MEAGSGVYKMTMTVVVMVCNVGFPSRPNHCRHGRADIDPSYPVRGKSPYRQGHISVGLTEVRMRIVLRVEWVVDVFLYVWVVACVMVCAYVIVYAKGQVRENGSLVSVNAGFELDEGADVKAGDREVFVHCLEAMGINVGSLYPSTLILTLTDRIHDLSPKTDHAAYHPGMTADMSPN